MGCLRHSSTHSARFVSRLIFGLLLFLYCHAGPLFPEQLHTDAGTVPKPITLPIEVMGEDGTEVSVDFVLPRGAAQQVASLWLQAHGLEYADLASVRVNRGAWTSLNNRVLWLLSRARAMAALAVALRP
jgi:hypothetical protein